MSTVWINFGKSLLKEEIIQNPIIQVNFNSTERRRKKHKAIFPLRQRKRSICVWIYSFYFLVRKQTMTSTSYCRHFPFSVISCFEWKGRHDKIERFDMNSNVYVYLLISTNTCSLAANILRSATNEIPLKWIE